MRTIFILLLLTVSCAEGNKVKVNQNTEVVRIDDTVVHNNQGVNAATLVEDRVDTLRGSEYRYAASPAIIDNKIYYPNFTVHILTDSILSLDKVKVLVKPDYVNGKKWFYPFKELISSKYQSIIITSIYERSSNYQSLVAEFKEPIGDYKGIGYLSYAIRQTGDYLICDISFMPRDESNQKSSMSEFLIFNIDGRKLFQKVLKGPMWQTSITGNGKYVMTNSQGFVSESVKTPFCSMIFDVEADSILWQNESKDDYMLASGGMGDRYSLITIIKDDNYYDNGRNQYLFDSETGNLYVPISPRKKQKLKISNGVIFYKLNGNKEILTLDKDFKRVKFQNIL